MLWNKENGEEIDLPVRPSFVPVIKRVSHCLSFFLPFPFFVPSLSPPPPPLPSPSSLSLPPPPSPLPSLPPIQFCQLRDYSELEKFIAKEDLTPEFGGTLEYNHREWVRFRMVSNFLIP